MNQDPTLYGSDAGAAAGLMALLGVYWMVYMVILVLMIVAMWKIFTKAGEEGWKSIIPIYNMIVLLKIVGRPWWWLLLWFVPIAQLVVAIIVCNDLSKSFGQGMGFTLGLIFLNTIFMLILGFGGSRYVGPGGVAMAPAAPAYQPPTAPPPYQPPAPPAV